MTSETWKSPRSEVLAKRVKGHAFADIRRARFNEDNLGELPRRHRVLEWRDTIRRYPSDDEKRQARFLAILDGWLKSHLPGDPSPEV